VAVWADGGEQFLVHMRDGALQAFSIQTGHEAGVCGQNDLVRNQVVADGQARRRPHLPGWLTPDKEDENEDTKMPAARYSRELSRIALSDSSRGRKGVRP
jgi:hypothetical protein